MRKQVVLLLCLLGIFLTTFAGNTKQPDKVLSKLDKQSIALYDALKQRNYQATDPLIIAWPTHLSFYHKGVKQDYSIISPQYTELKTIAHVALATFAIFKLFDPMSKDLNALQQYQAQINAAVNDVDKLALTAEQQQRQKKILSLTSVFIQTAVVRKDVSQAQLQQFYSQVSPLIQQNINEAAIQQIKLTNQAMAKIQQQLTSQQRQQLIVVIPVSKMPRRDYLLTQYFSKYLQVPADSDRLIIAEGLRNEVEIQQLIGTWKTDAALAQLFFNDAQRLKHDALANGAQTYLAHCEIDHSGEHALNCPVG